MLVFFHLLHILSLRLSFESYVQLGFNWTLWYLRKPHWRRYLSCPKCKITYAFFAELNWWACSWKSKLGREAPDIWSKQPSSLIAALQDTLKWCGWNPTNWSFNAINANYSCWMGFSVDCRGIDFSVLTFVGWAPAYFSNSKYKNHKPKKESTRPKAKLKGFFKNTYAISKQKVI